MHDQPAGEPLPGEVARAASARGEVVLRRRLEGGAPVLELRVNGVFVMDTHETRSEEALAAAALAQLATPYDVLVGGLGLGFTAREVLLDPRVRRLVVVELEEALVRWLADGTVPHGPALLADDRLEVRPPTWPPCWSRPTRRRTTWCCSTSTTARTSWCTRRTRPSTSGGSWPRRDRAETGGAVAVWSSSPSPRLEVELAAVLDEVEALPVPVRLQSREETYWLYLARRAAAAGG